MALDEEVKEYYTSLRVQSSEKRANNRAYATTRLDTVGIKYEIKNKGAHIIIADRWDFWPGTGKWRDRKHNKYSRGIESLIKAARRIAI
jgi:hypothetical protein